MSVSFDKVLAYVTQKHMGQKDKGGNSYMRHVLTVALQMDTEDEMIVGLCHDVVEDTNTTLNDLRELGLTETQIMAVDALTKKVGQTPEQYILEIKKSKVATKIKIADIKHNIDVTRLKNRHDLQEKDFERIKKYCWMLSQLGA